MKKIQVFFLVSWFVLAGIVALLIKALFGKGPKPNSEKIKKKKQEIANKKKHLARIEYMKKSTKEKYSTKKKDIKKKYAEKLDKINNSTHSDVLDWLDSKLQD
jgi:hypothetical protein